MPKYLCTDCGQRFNKLRAHACPNPGRTKRLQKEIDNCAACRAHDSRMCDIHAQKAENMEDAAPQAQEETRGAPAPADIRAGLADTFRGVLREYDAKSLDENEAIEEIFGAIRDFRQPQPPAPASPAGREPVDVDDARRLARLRGEIDYPEADPEAGAPGAQEGDA